MHLLQAAVAPASNAAAVGQRNLEMVRAKAAALFFMGFFFASVSIYKKLATPLRC